MAKIMNPTKVVTGKNTRFSYLIVNEPKSINGGTPKYSVSLRACVHRRFKSVAA